MNDENTHVRNELLKRLTEIAVWGKNRYLHFSNLANDPTVYGDIKLVLLGVPCKQYLWPYYSWIYEQLVNAQFDKFDFYTLKEQLRVVSPSYQPLKGWTREEVLRVIRVELERAGQSVSETNTMPAVIVSFFYQHAVEKCAVPTSTSALSESLKKIESLFLLARRELRIMEV